MDKNNRLFFTPTFLTLQRLPQGKDRQRQPTALMEDRYNDKYLMPLMGCCSQNEGPVHPNRIGDSFQQNYSAFVHAVSMTDVILSPGHLTLDEPIKPYPVTCD